MVTSPLIAVVDDDPWARSGLGELVTAHGYEVRLFASAQEFVSSPIVATTKCLITDLNMPGMSGLELLTHLRHAGYELPVIIVTAYPTEEVRSRAHKDGATSFLSKPVDEEALITCVTNALIEATQ